MTLGTFNILTLDSSLIKVSKLSTNYFKILSSLHYTESQGQNIKKQAIYIHTWARILAGSLSRASSTRPPPARPHPPPPPNNNFLSLFFHTGHTVWFLQELLYILFPSIKQGLSAGLCCCTSFLYCHLKKNNFGRSSSKFWPNRNLEIFQNTVKALWKSFLLYNFTLWIRIKMNLDADLDPDCAL